MGVLVWDKPERAISIEKWKGISADGAPPGVYMPNMSEAAMKLWKAKLIATKTDDPRVEIRKTAAAQILIIVRQGESLDKWGRKSRSNVTISMNGQARFSIEEFAELDQAVEEAWEILSEAIGTKKQKK